MSSTLLLKWGSLKGWSGIELGTPAREALERYHAEPVSMSAAMQRDTPTQRQALLDLIDAVDGEITNDWDGTTYATKEAAKKYVTEYRD